MSQHRSSDAEGQPSACHHFPDAFRRAFLKNERHARIATTEILQDSAQEHLRWWSDVSEPQFAFFAGGGPLHATDGLVQPLQKQADFMEQHGTGWSERHRAPG